MFTKEDRSTFRYWFAHWCAYQMTALNLKVWKFKYLFHDIEKPWLKLFLPYNKVQEVHRKYNRHHTTYKGGVYKIDYEAMLIDWECSRFTKEAAQLTARETTPSEVLLLVRKGYSHDDVVYFQTTIYNTLNKLGL